MSDRKYTAEQQEAIDARDCDVLVSAAAGGGKTAVLVERIISMITDEARPLGAERLLVVTFTEAAAGEMKTRIREAMADKLRDDPDNVFLRKQEAMIDNAVISTIHSFCRGIIQQYFHLIDIDPDFSVADETEAELLLAESAKELMEELYSSDVDLCRDILGEDDNRLFLDLVEIYGDKILDDELGRQVIRLYKFAQGATWPDAWLRQCYESEINIPVENTRWYDFLMADVSDILQDALEAAERTMELAKSPLIHENYIKALASDVSNIQQCITASGQSLEQFYASLDFDFEYLSRAGVKGLGEREAEAKALKEEIKRIRDEFVKTPLVHLKQKVFIKPVNETWTDIKNANRAVRGLAGMAREVGRRFAKAKRDLNLLDFNDLEHFAISILMEQGDDGEIRKSQAAIELSQRYGEIFVDEYQDSNAVQELILTAVSGYGGKRNVFMVGDIKQSIYRFRLADPEIFNEKFRTYRKDGSDRKLITLSKNFRSRQAVIDTVNTVFSRIMSPELGGTDYAGDAMLAFGADFYPPDNEQNVTEVICVTPEEKEDDGIETQDEGDEYLEELASGENEARVVAARITRLVYGAEPFYVTDRNGERSPVAFGDIAVIMRSPRSMANIYMKVFKEYGIPADAERLDGFFQAPEVLTALSFLRLIDNPRQDIPLAAALYSTALNFSPSELLEIKRSCTGDMYDAVTFYANEGTDEGVSQRLRTFLEMLEIWRDKAPYMGVGELLWAVYEDTGIFAKEGAFPGGALRQANLTELYEHAIRYEESVMKGLFSYLRNIDKIMEVGGFGVKQPAGSRDAVRIISAHKSKGLEFPVVFVCGLGKRFNQRDTQNRLLFHHVFGVGTMAADLNRRVITDTLKRAAISAKLRQESISEELRVLYVAMTRAKEKLILVGETKKPWDEELSVSYAGETLPRSLLRKNTRFMDFILQALSHYFNDNPENPCAVVCSGSAPKSGPDAVSVEPVQDDIKVTELRGEISRRLFYTYAFNNDTVTPQKLSVTEVKRLFYAQGHMDSGQLPVISEQETSLRNPAFYSHVEAFTAAARGTILHTVMEHIDVTVHKTRTDAAELTASLVDRGILTRNEADAADMYIVGRFLSSALADRMRSADRIWKEQRFVIGIPAGELAPQYASVGVTGDIMVHGVIDCVFMEGGRLVLVDYKTDKAADDAALWRRYKPQMELYKRAVENQFGQPVSEAIIYPLR